MSTTSELRLYHRLQVAAHQWRKAADAAVAATGLTTAQLAVLAVATDGLVQREIARILRINESAVTAMVRRLESAGLVARQSDPSDARLRRVVTTKLGREHLVAGQDAFGATNELVDGALSARELARLAGSLDRVAGAFDEDERG